MITRFVMCSLEKWEENSKTQNNRKNHFPQCKKRKHDWNIFAVQCQCLLMTLKTDYRRLTWSLWSSGSFSWLCSSCSWVILNWISQARHRRSIGCIELKVCFGRIRSEENIPVNSDEWTRMQMTSASRFRNALSVSKLNWENWKQESLKHLEQLRETYVHK